jgi:hypothetical protein
MHGRRTVVRIRVGEAFRLRKPDPGKSRTERSQAADEIMLRLAELLPPEYRGVYSGRAASSLRLIPSEA